MWLVQIIKEERISSLDLLNENCKDHIPEMFTLITNDLPGQDIKDLIKCNMYLIGYLNIPFLSCDV